MALIFMESFQQLDIDKLGKGCKNRSYGLN